MLHGLTVKVIIAVVVLALCEAMVGDVIGIVNADVAEDIVEDDGRTIGEVLVEQTLALRQVEIVDGVELACRLPAMDVATVVAPTGSLGVEGTVDGVVEAVPQCHHRTLAQQTVIGQ